MRALLVGHAWSTASSNSYIGLEHAYYVAAHELYFHISIAFDYICMNAYSLILS